MIIKNRGTRTHREETRQHIDTSAHTQKTHQNGIFFCSDRYLITIYKGFSVQH